MVATFVSQTLLTARIGRKCLPCAWIVHSYYHIFKSMSKMTPSAGEKLVMRTGSWCHNKSTYLHFCFFTHYFLLVLCLSWLQLAWFSSSDFLAPLYKCIKYIKMYLNVWHEWINIKMYVLYKIYELYCLYNL